MTFDPFENRLCRDIRNNLGHDFIKALEENDHDFFKSKAKDYISQYPHKHITDYIQKRLYHLKNTLNQVSALEKNNDIFYETCRILWNLELFFECHEWLEKKWMTSNGNEKQMLQGLIMSSVAYEQLQYGRISAAEKLASKALCRLQNNRNSFPACLKTDLLIEALTTLSPSPKI